MKRCLKKAGAIISIVSVFFCSACGKQSKLGEYKNLVDRIEDKSVNISYEDALTSYEGYLDNIMLLREQFEGQDYDADGLEDRVIQYFTEQNMKMYIIVFGNGSFLEMGPFEDNFTGIELTAVDLTGDNKMEMVFCGEHMGSTYPAAGSEIAVWALQGSSYQKMQLLENQNADSYGVGYPFYFERIGEQYKVRITCPNINFESVYEISEDMQEEFERWQSSSIGEVLGSEYAWRVRTESGEKEGILYLYIACIPRLPVEAELQLKWNGEKFEVVNVCINGSK